MRVAVPRRARYVAERVSAGRLMLRPAPGVDPRELKAYGGRWHGKEGLWSIPARLQDVWLLELDRIPVELSEQAAEQLGAEDELDEFLAEAVDLDRGPEHPAWSQLRGHQRVGVAFLTSRERGLLALTPGLGKTATAIVAADVRGYERVLVVAPLTLTGTWRHEIRTWSRNPETSVSSEPKAGAHWTIINPEQLFDRQTSTSTTTKLKRLWAQGGWDLVIMDESVLYKNRTARRTQAMAELGKLVPTMWMLSGLPVTKYADDLYAQLNILRPDAFSSYWRFVEHWCQVSKTPWGDKVVGNRRPEELQTYLRDLLLSRTPEQVPGLPEALFETVYVDLSERQLKALKQLKDQGTVEIDGELELCDSVLAQLTRAAQIVSYPGQLGWKQQKLGAKIEALSGMLEWVPTPAIVWTQFKATAEAVEVMGRKRKLRVGVITGEVSKHQRQELIDAFQAGELELLVIQLQTGKFGLSLTGARASIFLDRSFSSDDWAQAVARVRRLSSKAAVTNYVIHAGHTDDLIDQILSRKLRSIHDLELSDLGRYL